MTPLISCPESLRFTANCREIREIRETTAQKTSPVLLQELLRSGDALHRTPNICPGARERVGLPPSPSVLQRAEANPIPSNLHRLQAHGLAIWGMTPSAPLESKANIFDWPACAISCLIKEGAKTATVKARKKIIFREAVCTTSSHRSLCPGCR